MLTRQLNGEAIRRFSKAYTQLLETTIYKDKELIRSIFAPQDIRKAYEKLAISYFETITEFYAKNPDGNYLEELKYVQSSARVNDAAKEYLDLTGDETLLRFLHVYSYCVQEPSILIYDKNYNVISSKLESYFANVIENSVSMYSKFEKDINEGNFWWLKNSATTLRRQLNEDIIVLSERRLVYLCEKYFNRKVDIMKEFVNAVDGGVKLIPELDKAMKKNYKAIPYYCTWEIKPNGKKAIVMSEEPPKGGEYAYIAYHDRKENRETTIDNYYL